MDDDRFNVQIDVQISKPKGGDWRGDGTIAYQEKFSIPARGFQQIAKILGDLNAAVGNIKNAEPDSALMKRITERYNYVCSQYGEESLGAQELAYIMEQ